MALGDTSGRWHMNVASNTTSSSFLELDLTHAVEL
jgi:hypothetical protein